MNDVYGEHHHVLGQLGSTTRLTDAEEGLQENYRATLCLVRLPEKLLPRLRWLAL